MAREEYAPVSHAPSPAVLRELIAKQEIALNLALHSRGVDRGDYPTLRATYHDEADTSYGAPALALVRGLADSQKSLPGTLHRTSPPWIRLTSERSAVSEAYVIARLETSENGQSTERLVGGRYLDRHALADGRWRLMHRTYVLEWNINRAPSTVFAETAGAFFAPRGGKGGADPGVVLLATWTAAMSARAREEKTMSTTSFERDLDLALTRQALHELSMAYCRGADRADAALLASCFHDDASVVAGAFNGRAREFAVQVTAHIRDNLKRVFHSVANEWFQIDGDRAVGESYAIAVATASDGGRDTDTITGGRYLDRYERRAGEWKIAERVFVQDWNASQPTTAVFDDAFYGGLKLRGCYGPGDPVYAFWEG
jgi:hypothetical protein